MDSGTLMLWGVIFGSLGLGYFTYGRKQKAVVPLLVGIGLITLPYLVASLSSLIIGGVVLVAIPYFVKL